MLRFKDWNITSDGFLARQYDNLSRRVEVIGDLPEGWSWDLMIQVGDAMDIIHLEPMDGGLGHTLTAQQLSLDGYYTVQLRGRMGEVVKHTNTTQVFVPKSLSGDEKWPTIPSEFTELEQRLLTLNGNPPVPSDSGFWNLWDPLAGKYMESKYSTVGKQGEKGDSGLPDVMELSGTEIALTMENNIEYRCADAVTVLTIQGFTPAADSKVSMWALQFTAGDSITVTIPDNVKWAIAEPVFVGGVSYWLSFVPLVNGEILGVWVSNEQNNA